VQFYVNALARNQANLIRSHQMKLPGMKELRPINSQRLSDRLQKALLLTIGGAQSVGLGIQGGGKFLLYPRRRQISTQIAVDSQVAWGILMTASPQQISYRQPQYWPLFNTMVRRDIHGRRYSKFRQNRRCGSVEIVETVVKRYRNRLRRQVSATKSLNRLAKWKHRTAMLTQHHHSPPKELWRYKELRVPDVLVDQ
jgi:hypothetical protein